ncbi:MAG: hypothetical protein HN742_20595 [Lentisphaerae bacterium]|nr:hypothetical protein [Lentisphaerota bacterium]MBT4815173.1 hypothetical protein [Lentisphaerota bacterium]MBT5604946.1 hypothetical protein [Lentisphaerota bacterium]MBT7056460.1 hypothetical protein [Lentisphaerota bacterium]MBT7844291.1 hypothetical protein [Lentisphaerota bacterium]
MRIPKRIHILTALMLVTAAAIPFRSRVRRCFVSAVQVVKGRATVADRLREHGAKVRARLGPSFAAVNVSYPPKQIVFVGLKEERPLANRLGHMRYRPRPPSTQGPIALNGL